MPPPPKMTMLDLHDDWNLYALGVLNIVHLPWWLGLSTGATMASFLFYGDCCYLLADTCLLIFVPSCVPKRNRTTLLMHHLLVCSCMPVAHGNAVLSHHLLRTWVVELHSWNHIATRRLRSSWLTRLLATINKPLFVALRVIIFPLTYIRYAEERALLPVSALATQIPSRVHIPLSFAHAGMYGLMLKWGWALLGFSRR